MWDVTDGCLLILDASQVWYIKIKKKSVALVLGKGLICRQKLHIHLGMRDSSQWGLHRNQKKQLLYYHEASRGTPSSWSLDPIKFFNLGPYPKPLWTRPSWTRLYCWEYAREVLCTVRHRLSSPSLPRVFNLLPWLPHQLHRGHFCNRSEDNRYPIVG